MHPLRVKQYYTKTLFYGLLILITLTSNITVGDASPSETEVQLIPLAKPLGSDNSEISGLAWCKDKLIFLPQYPEFAGRRTSSAHEHFFYLLDYEQIEQALDIKGNALVPIPVRFNESDIRKMLPGFEGYEAIACRNNMMWLSIEVIDSSGRYQSYLVPAKFELDVAAPYITLLSDQLQYVEPQTNLTNISDEAVLLTNTKIFSFHEVNTVPLVSEPKVQWFSLTDDQSGSVPFVSLPYRLTDVTELDINQRFWAINYRYKNDYFNNDDVDLLFKKYGKGPSHQKSLNVERLIEFQFNTEGITRIQQPPIQLKMHNDDGRNWEGIARYISKDPGKPSGLLIITDRYPGTYFGFVPLPNHQ